MGGLPAAVERGRQSGSARLILTVQGTQAKYYFPCIARLCFLSRVRRLPMARKNLQVSEAPDNASGRPRKVLIYIRVWTEEQSNNQLSVDSQEEHLIAHRKRDGDNIAGIFCEPDEAGPCLKKSVGPRKH